LLLLLRVTVGGAEWINEDVCPAVEAWRTGAAAGVVAGDEEVCA
jgi:hypothetical protein